MSSRPLGLAGLAALAVAINLAAPTVFFDSQLMLGTGAAVFALLLFGWPGLAVGAAGLLVTVWRWGHPYELVIGLAFLAWLRWWLDRRPGRLAPWENGRLILAAIGFWMLVGLPAEILLFSLRMRVDLVMATGLGLKEAISAVLSTTAGLLLAQLWQIWRHRLQPGQLSVRGVTFTLTLLGVSLPGVLITLILSNQLKTIALQGKVTELQAVAAQVAAVPDEAPLRLLRGMAVRWPNPSTPGLRSSNDDLFARLDRDYIVTTPSRTNLEGLEILRPQRPLPVIRADQLSYWLMRVGEIVVVQPAEPLIRRLDYDLQFPSFVLLGVLLVLAAGLAELLASAVDRQFQLVTLPLQRQGDAAAMSDLGRSSIRELQQLVDLVNSRSRRARDLSLSLQQAQDQLAATALALTEAIPVGTYTMVLRPGAELAQFSFISERFLQICGLERQAVLATPFNAFACVHPDDYAAWVALNADSFAGKLSFKGQCRVVVGGQVRWILAESVPRNLADGSTVWEGVIADITDQVEAEQELRRILNVLPIPVGCNLVEGSKEIVFLNQRLLDTFGYTSEELPNQAAWAELAYPDPVYRQQVMATWQSEEQRCCAEGSEVGPMELVVACKDGSRRNVILTATLRDDRMVGAFLDVTERRRAEVAMETKLRTSLMAAAVAHEINQPLSSILINAQLLQAQLQALPEGEGRDALQPLLELQISESVRIEATIEKMRMLLRNVPTDLQRLDLCDVIASAQLYLRSLLTSHGVAVESSGLDQPQWLLGDGAQLKIAVANLIRNAIESCSQSNVPQPRVSLSLLRSVKADGAARLELRVADNGPGFSDLQLEQLLLASTKPQGSGVGLFVVNTAAQNHNGWLVLGRSADLGGAEVVLSLPALD